MAKYLALIEILSGAPDNSLPPLSPGAPDQGLPGGGPGIWPRPPSGGRPDNSLPGGGRPPRPDNSLPGGGRPPSGGTKPVEPDEGEAGQLPSAGAEHPSQLPAAGFILVYHPIYGWIYIPAEGMPSRPGRPVDPGYGHPEGGRPDNSLPGGGEHPDNTLPPPQGGTKPVEPDEGKPDNTLPTTPPSASTKPQPKKS